MLGIRPAQEAKFSDLDATMPFSGAASRQSRDLRLLQYHLSSAICATNKHG